MNIDEKHQYNAGFDAGFNGQTTNPGNIYTEQYNTGYADGEYHAAGMPDERYWIELDRMQKVCMEPDSIITRSEFYAESLQERKKYYNWMRQQVSEFTAGPYWE